MKLYYYPGACSLACHIALIESGLEHAIVAVDREKRTEGGRDYLTINPKGKVPTLELDDGTRLTENLAILLYIASRGGSLLPEHGIVRWRAVEALSYMATELHHKFRPFFRPDSSEADKDNARQALVKEFSELSDALGNQAFRLGHQMTIADPYMFVMLSWTRIAEVKLPENLEAYFARMNTLPSVRQALAEEGLS